jgi:hypothetical protein
LHKFFIQPQLLEKNNSHPQFDSILKCMSF